MADGSLLPPDLKLAFDRASVRDYDRDNRLHVAVTPISKANVCPYFGREVPEWRSLGLDPDRLYQLLRDPDELAKGAKTFNNLPLLSKHVPVTAKTTDGHQPELVIGSTGTDARFDGTYLKNSLVIWAQPGIQAVQSETKKELSSAYYYDADMTPGTFKGVAYDGVMRNIVGNHVALVEDGRAGDDVVVMDAAPVQLKRGSLTDAATDSKETKMTKTVLTRKAALVQGALYACLAPLLAQDAQIDLAPALKGVGPKNFVARKPAILAGVKKATDGKLAQDADIGQVVALLDSLDNVMPAEAADDEPDLLTAGDPVDVAKPAGEDDDPTQKVIDFLTDKVGADDLAAVKSMLSPPAAADVEQEDVTETNAAPAADEEEEEDKDMVTPAAMDAAIKKATGETAARVRQEQKALRQAEAFVRPWVGDLVAMDSADAVYAGALKALGVDVKDVHPSAYPTILKMQPLPGARETKKTTIAMDAASAAGYAERFPDAARIQTL